MWIDTHCHLDDARFAGQQAELLARAEAAGVEHIVTINCAQSVEELENALRLAERFGTAKLSATVGVHPHDADKLFTRPGELDEAWTSRFRALAERPEICALGETGLDFHYDHSDREAQREAFRFTIDVAAETGKPLVVHTRSAREATLEVLREAYARGATGIIHCFSEDRDFAHAALDLGFISSFSGITTFKKAEAIREAAASLPLEALLVETDAPYLAPVPHRGKTNEPSFVVHTGECIAALRALRPEALAEATTLNARRVFGLDLP